MIVGQILVDGTAYSCHRFPETRLTPQGVRRVLADLAAAEQLHALGVVEIRVHSQRGLERIMAAILGLDAAR